MTRVTRVLMSEPERPMRTRSRLAIAAAVIVALAALAPGFAFPSPRSHDGDGKRKTWEGTIRLSGTHDDLQTSLRVDAVAVQYDDETAEVFFERGASLRVEETVGSERRRFVRDHDGIRWSGEFDDVDREAWLVNILHAHGKMRRDVARAIARE